MLNSEAASNVLNILKARAEFDGGDRKNLYLRVASLPEESNTIYYDLTNKDWQFVRITVTGWDVIESNDVPVIFRRYSSQQSQVYPSKSKDYPADIFDKFIRLINIKGDDEDTKLLLKCYIISPFFANIPKPISMAHGEQGAAKTTFQELVKMLVDPSSVKTLVFPRDINELIQKLSHNYICYFDNVSRIDDWISDQLCRGTTGSGFSKRELYSDDECKIKFWEVCLSIKSDCV